MSLFRKEPRVGAPFTDPAPVTPVTHNNTIEEKKMDEQEVAFNKQSPLGIALEESINAANEYVAKASTLLNGDEEPERGGISVKRCRRASITLTDELVELRKLLP